MSLFPRLTLSSAALLAGLAAGIVLASAVGDAQELSVRQRHAWGRFPVGAWKRVRVYKETCDVEGQSNNSIEEAKTTLLEANDERFTLEIYTTLQAAGGDINRPPRTVSLSYYGLPMGSKPIIKTLSANASVEVEGREVECQIVEITSDGNQQSRRSRWFLGKSLLPLKRETMIANTDTGAVLVQSDSDVVCKGLLHRVLDRSRTVTKLRTVLRRPESTSTAYELHCPQIPGGVVQAWTKVVDAEGRTKERTSLELIDFGLPE